jgi:hypothetical protein
MASTVEPRDEGGWLSGSCGPGDRVDLDSGEEVAGIAWRVSWGPTFGPETGADVARPVDESLDLRGWHPPGGSI